MKYPIQENEKLEGGQRQDWRLGRERECCRSTTKLADQSTILTATRDRVICDTMWGILHLLTMGNWKAVSCGMIQYSIRPKLSAIRAQGVYFLHSTMPSVTCVRLSDVSVICRVTYLQFPIQSAFLSYIGRRAAPALICFRDTLRKLK